MPWEITPQDLRSAKVRTNPDSEVVEIISADTVVDPHQLLSTSTHLTTFHSSTWLITLRSAETESGLPPAPTGEHSG